jgi:acyl-CoA synthetase (AMP-forming)/AMP-acid ligase II
MAVQDRQESLTYAALRSRAESLAASLLQSGCRLGDRVSLLMDSSASYCVAYLGIMRAGCTAVPLNTDSSRRTVHFILGRCTPRLVIGQGKYLDRYGVWEWAADANARVIVDGKALSHGLDGVEAWSEAFALRSDPRSFPQISASDLACILFTSGTTGEPKGVMLSHGNLVANTRSIV